MIAIVDYKAGNIHSVENAIERLGIPSVVTSDVEVLINAEKVIFPGVGDARQAISNLKETELDKVIPTLKQPVLGICLGLQLMCDYTEEGEVKALGIFNTAVKRFPPSNIVPHMGWNNFEKIDSELLKEIQTADDVYFVHSYYAEICEHTVGSTNYILPFSSVLHKDNFWATQFHPEKSGKIGSQILKNFIEL